MGSRHRYRETQTIEGNGLVADEEHSPSHQFRCGRPGNLSTRWRTLKPGM